MQFDVAAGRDPRLLPALSLFCEGLGRFLVDQYNGEIPAAGEVRPDAVGFLNAIVDHWWEFESIFASERSALLELRQELSGDAPLAGPRVDVLLAQMEQVLDRVAPREAVQVSQLRTGASEPHHDTAPQRASPEPAPPDPKPQTPGGVAAPHRRSANARNLFGFMGGGLAPGVCSVIGGAVFYLHKYGTRLPDRDFLTQGLGIVIFFFVLSLVQPGSTMATTAFRVLMVAIGSWLATVALVAFLGRPHP